MTLQEANDFFEGLINKSTEKSEIKTYEKFLHILTELKSRNFSTNDLQSIESELDRLGIESNPKNRKKYFDKALSNFEKYLKVTFSLTSKGYYTKIGAGLGTSFGIIFGIVFLTNFERSLGIALGLGVGMTIGLAIGRSMDNKAISEGRAL